MTTDDDVTGMFWHFLIVSLLAVGGLSTVIPDIQRYVVEHGWLTARQFGEVYALSQATPGPNVMVLTMIGAVVGGWAGAVAATTALFLPGLVVTFAMIHLQSRNPDTPVLTAIRRGMAPVAIGLTVSTAWVMFSALFTRWDLASLAAHWPGAAIALVTAWICSATRLNPLWLMAGGAVVGMAGIF
jgi:chromate transporter